MPDANPIREEDEGKTYEHWAYDQYLLFVEAGFTDEQAMMLTVEAYRNLLTVARGMSRGKPKVRR